MPEPPPPFVLVLDEEGPHTLPDAAVESVSRTFALSAADAAALVAQVLTGEAALVRHVVGGDQRTIEVAAVPAWSGGPARAVLVRDVTGDVSTRDALDTAVALSTERGERLTAATERAGALARLTAALAGATYEEDVARIVARHAAAAVGAAFSNIAMRTVPAVGRDDPGQLVVVHGGSLADDIARRYSTLSLNDAVPLAEATRTGSPVLVASPAALRRRYPHMGDDLARTNLRSLAAVPLQDRDGETVGAVGFGWTTERGFGDDVDDLRTVTGLCGQALDRTRLLEGERRARRFAERSHSRLRQLQELTALLSRSLTVDEVLNIVAEEGSALLGAPRARVALPDPAGEELELVYSVGAAAADGSRRRLPVGAASPMCEAFRTGKVVWVGSGEELAGRYPDSTLLGGQQSFAAACAVPLIVDNETVGVWGVAFRRPVAPDEDILQLAWLFGEQAGQALQRARSHECEVARRARAERSQHLAATLAQALTVAEVADALARGAMEVFGATSALVSLQEGQDDPVLVETGRAGNHATLGAGWQRVAVDGTTPVGEAVWKRETLAVGPEQAASRWPSIAALVDPRRWWLAVPLDAGGEVVGAMALTFAREPRFGPDERVAVAGVAAQGAVALARAQRYEHEHQVALTLQRALLPERRIEHPRLEIASRYSAGVGGIEVGGDWFDVLDPGDGPVVLVIGDVVGRGVRAAAAMGQLRSATEAFVGSGAGPAELLDRLDRFARSVPDAACSTVACMAIDAAAGTVRYALAGHPPPLLRHPDGRVELLEGGRSTPLGVPAGSRPEAVAQILPGSNLVLYTDGLVERRNEPIDAGIDRLVGMVAGWAEAVSDRSCAALIEEAMADYHQGDDIALVCATLLPVDRFRHSFAAQAEEVTPARRAFATWLQHIGIGGVDHSDLVLAAAEACANAVEHGHRYDGRQVEMRARLEAGGLLTLVVADGGTWREPSPGRDDRGRGLPIMRAVSDEIDIDTSSGTTVRLRRRLSPLVVPAASPPGGAETVSGERTAG